MWPISASSPSRLILTSSLTMLKAISSALTAPIEIPMGA